MATGVPGSQCIVNNGAAGKRSATYVDNDNRHSVWKLNGDYFFLYVNYLDH